MERLEADGENLDEVKRLAVISPPAPQRLCHGKLRETC